MRVAVIGGGAAGFFAAFSVKKHHPLARVVIYEKTSKLLSKVKISGGGRCNVTNATFSISELSRAYPRGGKPMKRLFNLFNTKHTMQWFEERNVALKTEENNHVFPQSDSSQTIIDCFLKEAELLEIEIRTGEGVNGIRSLETGIELTFGPEENEIFNKVIVATGGSPKRSGLEWLEEIGHEIEDPFPSLFTFNMPDETIRDLMGVAVKEVIVSVQGTRLKAQGALLITHWGMSGPAILKISSFGARELAEMNYEFKVAVNWANQSNVSLVFRELERLIEEHPQKQLSSYRAFTLPERLWLFLLEKSDLAANKKWSELGKKGLNKLSNTLCNDLYSVRGKTTFKEEFVTCGGVSLSSIVMKSMESKAVPGLYFAGEVMDIDAITGGFNFQAAWTTGFIAGQLK